MKKIYTKPTFIVISLLILVVAINFFMLFQIPIFPDEINWRFTHSRAIIDGFTNFSYYKPCYLGEIRIPEILYPQFIFLSIFSLFDHYFFYRIFPFLSYLFLLFSLFVILKKKFISNHILLFLLSFFIISTLGNSGSIWHFTSRAEFLIYFYIGLIFLLNNKNYNQYFIFFATFIFWSVASIAHPKFFYFIIVQFYILFILDIKLLNKFLLFIFSFLFVLIGVKTNQLIYFSHCDINFSEYYNWIALFNINPLLLFSNFNEFIVSFSQDFLNHINNIFDRAPSHLIFSSNREAPFLPNIKTNFVVSLANFSILFFYFFNLSISLFLSVRLFKDLLFDKARLNYFKNISLLIYMVIYVLILFNRTTNAYEITFWITTLCFLNVIIFNIFFISVRFNLKNNISAFLLDFINLASFKATIVFLFFLIISTLIIFKYYYLFSINSNKGSWAGMSVPNKYFTNPIIDKMEIYFRSNCIISDKNTLFLFDDHTYTVLKNFSGSKISPVTYTMIPFYKTHGQDKGKLLLDQFLSKNYKKTIFYGSCGFKNELPESFKIRNQFKELELCCMIKESNSKYLP